MKSALLKLLFPPICLHCQNESLVSHPLLCPPCTELLELLRENSETQYPFDALYALFDTHSPAKSLMFAKNPDLIGKLFFSFLLLPLDKLGWIKPDIIIPYTSSKTTRVVAELLSIHFSIPCKSLLHKAWWLDKSPYRIRRPTLLEDRHPWVIQDKIPFCDDFHEQGLALQSANPSSIHLITLFD